MSGVVVRPRPILAKLQSVGSVLAALAGLVSWAGSFGLLTTQQSAASSAALAVVPGVITAVGGLLVAFGVTKSSEPLVTPVEDPAVVIDGKLLPLVPDRATGGAYPTPGEIYPDEGV